MRDSQTFRRRLAARILGLLGATALALPPTGCNGDNSAILDAPVGVGGGGGGGGGDAGSMTTGTGGTGGTTTGTGGMAACPASQFSMPLPQSGICLDANDAFQIVYFSESTCPPTGEWVTDLGSPTIEGDECCYPMVLGSCEIAGRPYLVEDRARVASPERGAGTRGWSQGDPPSLAELTREDREELAAAWAADALLEHASVASFARASLALLAAGAPAELVELTHRAALDEVRHARLCFALASAYAGEDIAPGPFPLGSHVAIEESLVALAVSTFKEGCLGETVAAVIAAEQLARATDPAVVAALTQIAADEARHAELAWQTVAWALRAGGSDVHAAVSRALCEATAMGSGGRAPDLHATPRRAMEAHGRLDAAATAKARASAIAEIVAPAARTLLGRAHEDLQRAFPSTMTAS